MKEATATVRNEQGIHCRPAANIILEAKEFEGELKVTGEYGECDLRNAMDLIMLALGKGSEVTIQVDGPGEEAFCEKLIGLFEFNFDFPPE